MWKQKGEEYRIVHGDGWLWNRSTRKSRHVSQNTVGLRPVAQRLQAWKAARKAQIKQEKETSPKEEPMDMDDETMKDAEGKPKSEENQCEEVKSEVATSEKEGEDVKMEHDVKEEETMETEDQKKDEETEQKETANQKKDVKATLAKVTLKVEFGSTEEEAMTKEIDGVLDISAALLKHTHYPKVPKPASKLDSLLERRIRQHAYEMRQKSIIEQVLMKFKIQENARKALKESKDKAKQQEKKGAETQENQKADLEIEAPAAMAKKQKKQEEEESRRRVKKCSCYSAACVLASSPDGDPHAVNDVCYSFCCQKKAVEDRAKEDDTKGDENELSDDSDTEESSTPTPNDTKDKKRGRRR